MAEPSRRVWLGGEHDFRLTIAELEALDDLCLDGVLAAWRRLVDGKPRLADIREPVRLGLIGGGMAADQAAKKVTNVETYHGLGPLIPLATAIVYRGFFRREEVALPAGEPVPPETAAD